MNVTDIFIYLIIFGILGVCGMIYMQNKDDYDLKCIISTVDGKKYCVRQRNHLNAAADLLAKTTDNCKKLVEYMHTTHPSDDRCNRLKSKFNSTKIAETLPTSEYTAYSENKGEKIAFCLNQEKQNNSNLIDEHTLMFVAIHELAHICTKTIGHDTEFWQNFKWLLENAKTAGIHDPVDYKKSPKRYCSMDIRDNPYYDI